MTALATYQPRATRYETEEQNQTRVTVTNKGALPLVAWVLLATIDDERPRDATTHSLHVSKEALLEDLGTDLVSDYRETLDQDDEMPEAERDEMTEEFAREVGRLIEELETNGAGSLDDTFYRIECSPIWGSKA